MQVFIKRIIYLVLLPVIALLCAFRAPQIKASQTHGGDVLNARTIINKMMTAIDNVKTLKYDLKASERIDGKMTHISSSVKLQRNPRKLYLYLDGAELLWVQGQNDGNALVNPGSFPFFNLNLDPNGYLLRRGQHHTINQIGFQYFEGIIKSSIEKAGKNFDKYFIYDDEEVWAGRPCYKISIFYPQFTYVPYTVQQGETLVTIAQKLHVSEYMILQENNNVSSYDDVAPGEKIMVPNAYAKMTVLLIDKQYFLPIHIKDYDDKGLYEDYEYHNLQVNPVISPEEFTSTYKDYHF